MTNENKIKNLKSQKAKFNSAKNKLTDAIRAVGIVKTEFSDKKVFSAEKITDIIGKIQLLATDLEKKCNQISNAIGSINSKINKLKNEDTEKTI